MRRNKHRKNCPGKPVLLLIPAAVLFAAAGVVPGISVLAEEDASSEPVIICPEPDGNNGWYISPPELTVCCDGRGLAVTYTVELPSGRRIEGKISPDGTEPQEGEDSPCISVLPGALWEDGKNTLTVKAVSQEDGREQFRETKEIFLDRIQPSEIRFSYPSSDEEEGRNYSSEIQVNVSGSDGISGVEKIVYALENGEGGTIRGSSGSVRVRPGYQGTIRAYAVNTAGIAGKVSVSDQIVCEDAGPQIRIETDGGDGPWHSSHVRVRVSVKDPGEPYGFASGLSALNCYVGDGSAGKKNWDGEPGIFEDSLSFLTDRSSVGGRPVPVTVHAADRAGNTSVRTEYLYIDRFAPVLTVSGIHDQMIRAAPVTAVFDAEEENVLERCTVTVVYTDMDGNRSEYAAVGENGWKSTDSGQKAEVKLEKDGIYECIFLAEDGAGHCTEQKMTVVIDSRSPLIRYVGRQDGVCIPYFQWNYRKEDMIKDLTEYSYRMTLDGQPYHDGTRITEEGEHILEVQAEDAAGNVSAARAVFVIDHTPPRIRWSGAGDGEAVEEKAELSIWVDGEGERLKSLILDGEEQRLSPDSCIFQTEIRDAGFHTVEVCAEDRAGNTSQEKIRFTVAKKQSLISRILSPDDSIGKEQTAENEAEPDTDGAAEGPPLWIFPAAAAVAATAAGIGKLLIRQKNNRSVRSE